MPKNRSPLDKAAGHEVVWQQVAPLFEATRPIVNCQFVYAIGEQDDGAVKIGTAKDPIARLRGMQTGNPRRLRLEHVLVGDLNAEKLLHQLWETHAVRAPARPGRVHASPGTEWFNADIRAELFPVLTTAAAQQVAHIRQATTSEIRLDKLEHIIREAHVAHGIQLRGRDEVRLLGAHAGYVVGNRSRL